MKFPIKIFEDIVGTDFEKHNKKHVTEDYVSCNLFECGWDTYRPFNDTGIDIIAIKKVCPNNHTPFHEKTTYSYNCNKCGSSLLSIHRFIQVKTREVKGDDSYSQFFGYTLKSKDIRTDPRHVFLLYSDATDEFIIIPMYDYLKMFHNKKIGKSHFGTPSFRVGNNKVNSLKRESDGSWVWKSRPNIYSFMPFVNENGMELISNPKYDIELSKYVMEIVKMKFDLFYNYSKGQQVDSQTEREFNDLLEKSVLDNLENISNNRQITKSYLESTLDKSLKESINGYLIKYKEILFK